MSYVGKQPQPKFLGQVDDLTVAGDVNVDTNTLVVDADNNRVGINTDTPNRVLEANSTQEVVASFKSSATRGTISFSDVDTSDDAQVRIGSDGEDMVFLTGAERMRIDSSGDMRFDGEIQDTSADTHTGDGLVTGNIANGAEFNCTSGTLRLASTTAVGLIRLNLRTIDDDFIQFRKNGALIGDIDTNNGTSVRYNTFTGAHWSQFEDLSQPELPYGTVVSTVDDMMKWSTVECNMGVHTEIDEETGETIETEQKHRQDVSGTLEVGSTVTIRHEETGENVEGTVVENKTAPVLARIKVSDAEADPTVYGVFTKSFKDGDVSVESLGVSRIRIGSGVTVQRGDLLESAGDGTARPQTGDTANLFKAGTIAKVTSTTVVETYDDGSYTVPCTLHCG